MPPEMAARKAVRVLFLCVIIMKLVLAMQPQVGRQSAGAAQPIHHCADLLEIKHGRSMGIHHGRMIHMFVILVQHCLDDQFLHVDVGAHQRRELRRQFTDARRLEYALKSLFGLRVAYRLKPSTISLPMSASTALR